MHILLLEPSLVIEFESRILKYYTLVLFCQLLVLSWNSEENHKCSKQIPWFFVKNVYCHHEVQLVSAGPRNWQLFSLLETARVELRLCPDSGQ